MSDIFTIVLFSAILFLFLFITYGTGVLDSYFKGYRIYSDAFQKQSVASKGFMDEEGPNDSHHREWRGEESQQT